MNILICILLVSVCLSEVTLLTENPQWNEVIFAGYIDADQEKSEHVKNTTYKIDTLLKGVNIRINLVDCPNHGQTLFLCRYRTSKTAYSIWFKGQEIPWPGEHEPQLMAQWAKRVAAARPHFIQHVEQLKNLVNQHRFVYVYFGNPEKRKHIDEMQALAKKFSHFHYAFVFNNNTRQELQSQINSFCVYKYPFELENKNIYDKRDEHNIQGWIAFTYRWAYHEVTQLEQSQNLPQQRFNQTADFSFIGLLTEETEQAIINMIPVFYKYALEHTEHEFRLMSMLLRENHMLKLYYQIRDDGYPAMVYIKMKDGNLSVHSERFNYGDDYLKVFEDYVGRIDQLPFYRISSPIPANNGLGNGKGSEKLIQELVYDSIGKTMEENPDKWYLVLYSLFQGCDSCTNFYKEYKKLRSYYDGEPITDKIVFARYEFLKNYLDEREVTKVPDIILYKDVKDGVRERVRYQEHHDYDSLMKWLKKHYEGTANEEL